MMWPSLSLYRSLTGRIEGRVTGIIWALLIVTSVLDIATPPEYIAICLGFSIPIFLSLFETKPYTIMYATVASLTSILDLLLKPESVIDDASVTANIAIAIAVQWLVAFLVRLQRERLNQALEQAERQRRFVNILSHEVGTPLTVITGQATRLGRLAASAPADALRSRVDKITSAAHRIELLVGRIRLASSLEDGLIPIERRVVDLRMILQQVVEQLREENAGREIVLDAGADPEMIQGDEMLLRQMLENIVTNGLRYSSADDRIVISLLATDKDVSIKIVDNGRGISRQDLSRVGTPYYRGENSKGVSGTGIGLYVVQKIVEAHDGRLTIDSKPGAGTSVSVDLPR